MYFEALFSSGLHSKLHLKNPAFALALDGLDLSILCTN